MTGQCREGRVDLGRLIELKFSLQSETGARGEGQEELQGNDSVTKCCGAAVQIYLVVQSRAEQNRTEPAAAATHVELSGFSRLKRQEEILRNNFKHSCFNIHGFM